MNRRTRTVVVIGLLSTSFGVTSAVVRSQSRETLETKVTASGTEIVFKWTKKHPWDAELSARGASLWAEYRTAKGVGLECLQPGNANAAAPGVRRGGYSPTCFSGNPVMRADDRTIHFQLPEGLTAEPLGAVCLQLRLADQRIVPIRQATKQGGDTARFQYVEWARNVTARAQKANAEAKRDALQSATSTQAAAVQEQEQSNLRKGWRTLQACSELTGATVNITRSDRPVAPPADQDTVARMMCVIRLDNGKPLASVAKPPTEILQYLDAVNPELLERWRTVRGPQLKPYVDDWARLSPQIQEFKRRFPTPHFGAYSDALALQSLTRLSLKLMRDAAAQKKAPDADDVLGYVGGSVEAYDRCVRDGKSQLSLNFTEAQGLDTAVKSLPERLRQQAVQECEEGVKRLDSMRARLTSYQESLATAQRDISQFAAAPAAARNADMNAVACMP